jgi:alpha-tubulin suppressor-like RCC1 family protein
VYLALVVPITFDLLAVHSEPLSKGSGFRGQGHFGQLGRSTNLGTNTANPTPTTVTGLAGAIAVSAGDAHSLALLNDGTVRAWGENDGGQLGDGTLTDRSAPTRVGSLTGVMAVAAGGNHSLALAADGSVWAWGANASGQLGDGSTVTRNLPVRVSGLTDVVAIAAGSQHSLAIRADGSVWAWGSNAQGQLGFTNGIGMAPIPREIPGLLLFGHIRPQKVEAAPVGK